MNSRLDNIDKRVIYRLLENARRTSAPDIAEEVNVSAGTIRNRINQLEAQGVIKGYHANIDYERAEGLLTNVFICNSSAADREKCAKQILQIPGVVNVREVMSGRGDLRVKAVGADTNTITRIGQAIEEIGVEIEDEGLLQREYFAPYQPFGPEEVRDRPSMTDFLKLSGDAEVAEFVVDTAAPVTGQTLAESKTTGTFGDDVLVITIERDGTLISPNGQTILEAGDVVTVFSPTGIDEALQQSFAGSLEVEES